MNNFNSEILGYVYVITTKIYEKNNIYKIGCTKNLKNRLKIINSTRILSDQFFIVKYWQTHKYYETENGIHKQLLKYRLNNEFFQCNLNIIENGIINFCKKKNIFFILKDIIYFFMLNNKIYWNYNEKLYFNQNTLKKYTDNQFIKKLKIFMKNFDKNNFSKYYSKNTWYNILEFSKLIVFKNISKENYEIKELSLLLDELILFENEYQY